MGEAFILGVGLGMIVGAICALLGTFLGTTKRPHIITISPPVERNTLKKCRNCGLDPNPIMFGECYRCATYKP